MSSQEDFRGSIVGGAGRWLINGQPPPMGARLAAHLAQATARCLCKVDPWPDDTPPASSPLEKPNATASGAVPPPGLKGNPAMINMAIHLDQKMQASEIAYLPTEEIQRYKKRYYQVMERFPLPQVATTVELLAALEYVMNTLRRAPYADFAVVGPFANRNAKRHKLQGSRTDSMGYTIYIEIYGPANFDMWDESWSVYFTAGIQLNFAGRTVLEDYRLKIKMYYVNFGGMLTWSLLYQADVRMRQENMDYLHDEALEAHNAAVIAGGLTPYDPSRPWDHIFRLAVKDEDF